MYSQNCESISLISDLETGIVNVRERDGVNEISTDYPNQWEKRFLSRDWSNNVPKFSRTKKMSSDKFSRGEFKRIEILKSSSQSEMLMTGPIDIRSPLYARKK